MFPGGWAVREPVAYSRLCRGIGQYKGSEQAVREHRWNVFPERHFPVGSAPMVGRPLVLAHRGASAVAAENTVAAFAKARELGADGVELDVRRSADGVLVVHHDAALHGGGVIASLTLA